MLTAPTAHKLTCAYAAG